MSTHRRAVRPRYGRIAALGISLLVSAVSALAAMGVLATSSAQAGPSAEPASYTRATTSPAPDTADGNDSAADTTASDTGAPPVDAHPRSDVASPEGTSASADASILTALPADSGHGRRIVFSQSRQRVWLVDAPAKGSTAAAGAAGSGDSDTVKRTYLVSGSVTHNLQPGTYSVYSKSRWAVGVEDSGVMQYFVRFTQGPTGAAIGFHSIPTHHEVPLQSRSQLGTPQSHGCIRQDLPDAIALWSFAPVGTKVVVVA